MYLLAEIIFWGSILGLVHTYLLYPLIMKFLSRGRSPNQQVYEKGETWPYVSVIMSVYNEELVISEKLESLAKVDYPAQQLQIFIGSDCSSDATNALVQAYADQYPNFHFFPFTQRRGKPIVVNDLVKSAAQKQELGKDHLFLFTDASVILEEDTLLQLAQHFKNSEIFLVDANMQSRGVKKEGISRSERQYVNREVNLKQMESLAWGKMIGPFGGCYALRSSFYEPVPSGYLVDDFYITMKAYEKGGLAINELKAYCHEGLSHEISEEYRRKARISAGNFKNLATFKHLLWPPWKSLAFGFLSHKVLRWFGPFFIIFAVLTSTFLSFQGNLIYLALLSLLAIWLILIPMLDTLLRNLGMNVLLFRNITYFNKMNLALLEGFFTYLKGVQSNVWQPPKRNG